MSRPTDGLPALDVDVTRSTLTRGAAWSAAERWGSKAVGSLVFVVLARLVAPADFGAIALIGSLATFAGAFIDQGFAQALVQRRVLERRHVDTAFTYSLVVGTVLAALMAATSRPLASLLLSPDDAALVAWFSLTFVLAALSSVPSALLQRRLQFRSLALRTLAATVAGGAVGVVLAVLGYGVWALLAQTLVSGLAVATVLWAVVPVRPRLGLDAGAFGELFTFGLPLLGRDLLGHVNRRLDDILVGAVLGATALGIYTVAYRLLLILTELVVQTPTDVLFSALSRTQDDEPRSQRLFVGAIRASAAAGFPAFVGLSLMATTLVPLVFGAEWSAGGRVLQVLALIGVVHSLDLPNHVALTAAGRPGTSFRLNAINAVTNAVGFGVAVQFGLIWVAVVYVVRGFVVLPLSVTAACRATGVARGRYARSLLAPAAATAGMAAGVVVLQQWLPRALAQGLLHLLVVVPVAAAAYLALLWVLDRPLVSELASYVRRRTSA